MVKDEKDGDKVAVAVKAIKSIEDLSGVGPATAEKLKEAGFTDLMGLAVASPTMVADADPNTLHRARASTRHHQMLLDERARERTQAFPTRRLVIGSLSAHFRAEYMGRGVLAQRQQPLTKHIHARMQCGDIHNAV